MTIPNTMVLENLTRRHGVKIDSKASVEDICLAVGDVVNHENIASASRMNNAIVLFLSTIEKANEIVGLTRVRTRDVFLSSRTCLGLVGIWTRTCLGLGHRTRQMFKLVSTESSNICFFFSFKTKPLIWLACSSNG